MNAVDRFGSVVRKLRKELMISQEELAARCELDRTFISLIERGRRHPTLRTIFKLASALDISPSKLIKLVEGGKNESNKN